MTKSTIFPIALILTALLSFSIANAQTLTIVSGNGQLVPTSGIARDPLTVRYLDPTGKPVVGAQVDFFTSETASGYANPQSALTDATGQATTNFLGAGLTAGLVPYVSGQVVASVSSGAVTATFNETTVGINAQGGSAVSAIVTPNQGTGAQFSGPAGSTSTSTISVQVSAQSNSGVASNAVPGVSLVITPNPSSTGTISCMEGTTLLTNNLGTATCTPVFGKVGTGSFSVTVGSAFVYSPYQFTVTVGPPAIMMISSGNNQSGAAGSTLPAPIVAVVEDLGGNTIPGIDVVFTSVTPGGATFTNIRTPSDANGKVSANVVLGNVPGAIQISVRDAAGLIQNPAIFTETVSLSISGVQKISGDQQNAVVNAAFAQPLVLQVNTTAGQPAANTPVTFAVTSGSATVATPSATTGQNGQASTTVTAGATAGPVVITATVAGFSTTFNLTVNPPGPSNVTFSNAAYLGSTSISPGSIATINGSGIANNLQGIIAPTIVGPLPLQVAGVTVQFNGVFAPILSIGNSNGTQFINVQVPFETLPGTVPVLITVAGGGSATVPATVSPASPGLFQYTGGDNVTRAVALRPDGTVVSPFNPARRGENVRVYATGLGPVNPAVGTNSFAPFDSTAAVVYPLVVGLNNLGVDVVQARYASNLIGVEEITFRIPADTGSYPPGALQVSLGVQGPSGAEYYSQGALLNIQ